MMRAGQLLARRTRLDGLPLALCVSPRTGPAPTHRGDAEGCADSRPWIVMAAARGLPRGLAATLGLRGTPLDVALLGVEPSLRGLGICCSVCATEQEETTAA